jgi:murein DD-endopeptidase MepM/ murein hydrolase activator NlpD
MQPVLLALFVTVTYPTVNNQELILPLENISEINHGYNQRRGRKIHGAIDQYASIGTPVRAVADGIITDICSMSSYMHETNRILRRFRRGFAKSWPAAKKRMRQCNCTWRLRRRSRGTWRAGVFISIKHISDKGKIFISQYMHLSKILVVLGEKVKQGQVIGKSGDTAIIDSDPHLHFQIKYNEIKQDPKKYIKDLDGPFLTMLKKIPPVIFSSFKHYLL